MIDETLEQMELNKAIKRQELVVARTGDPTLKAVAQQKLSALYRQRRDAREGFSDE